MMPTTIDWHINFYLIYLVLVEKSQFHFIKGEGSYYFYLPQALHVIFFLRRKLIRST